MEIDNRARETRLYAKLEYHLRIFRTLFARERETPTDTRVLAGGISSPDNFDDFSQESRKIVIELRNRIPISCFLRRFFGGLDSRKMRIRVSPIKFLDNF